MCLCACTPMSMRPLTPLPGETTRQGYSHMIALTSNANSLDEHNGSMRFTYDDRNMILFRYILYVYHAHDEDTCLHTY